MNRVELSGLCGSPPPDPGKYQKEPSSFLSSSHFNLVSSVRFHQANLNLLLLQKGKKGGTSIHRQRTASSTASGDCSTESVFSYIDAGNKLLQKRFFESENKVSHAFLTQKLAKSALTLRPFHLSPLPLSLSALLLPPPFELKSNKL